MSNTRIYVACLASYNAGTLHGVWIDCEGKDADDIKDEVAAMLRASPEPNVLVDCPTCDGTGEEAGSPDGALLPCETCGGRGRIPSAEEWAIHDREGFGDLIGEYSSFEDVAKHANMIGKYGNAWIAYCSNVGAENAAEGEFADTYQGNWDSERDFAEQMADDMGLLDRMPEDMRCYFNYDAFARDLFIGDYWRDDDTGAVFLRN